MRQCEKNFGTQINVETIALPRAVSPSKDVGKKFLMLNCTNCSVNPNQTFLYSSKLLLPNIQWSYDLLSHLFSLIYCLYMKVTLQSILSFCNPTLIHSQNNARLQHFQNCCPLKSKLQFLLNLIFCYKNCSLFSIM